MLKRFYPTRTSPSAYEIDYRALYDEGVRGILYDIDNTLVPHGAPADERARKLFRDLQEIGLKTCLISNNQAPRVEMFNEAIGTCYICDAHKPLPKNYRKASAMMGITPQKTVFVGDQLFTDIYGANLAGIRSILVSPIHPKEEIQIVLKRKLERIVLFFYRRSLKRRKRK